MGSTAADEELLHAITTEEELEEELPQLDGSLVLSMERTLFAAFNQSWTLMMLGVGLMCIPAGASGDRLPERLGEFVVCAAVAFAICR